MEMKFNYNDGGRELAGYKGKVGDCVCRSIAIATNQPYEKVWKILADGNANQKKTKRSNKYGNTADRGINTKRKWFDEYMKSLAFDWVATMKIGSGCKVHLRADELPKGILICNVSKHFTCVIDGVINDTYDCSRYGTRCVYGYYIKSSS